MKTIYITTSIPYVNASPHLGHALEFIQADAIARYFRITTPRVVFQTGTDENAFKNALAAQRAGIPPLSFVEANAERFRDMAGRLSISHDVFIRTGLQPHRAGVHAFWQRIAGEDLYQDSYSGLYCPHCEDFLHADDLVNGKCPEHDIVPEKVEEQNYFFRLSRYQDLLDEIISGDRIKIYPPERKNEILGFIRAGLKDISISREASRSSGWGIPVPGDERQIIYVWIDALINYLTGQDFGVADSWQSIWSAGNRKLHVIGRNVWKFHGIYWPALLLSAGLPLPNEIIIHGFLSMEGEKISKTAGSAVPPTSFAQHYGSDALRYYLLAYIPTFKDGNFSAHSFREEAYKSDLANVFGNLVSRLLSLREQSGCIPLGFPDAPAPEGFHGAMQEFALDRALSLLWDEFRSLNGDIEQARPWELTGPEEKKERGLLLNEWSFRLYRACFWLRPFLPESAEKVLRSLSTGRSEARNLFPRIRR